MKKMEFFFDVLFVILRESIIVTKVESQPPLIKSFTEVLRFSRE